MNACTLQINDQTITYTVTAVPGTTVLDAMRARRLYLPAICGGRGTCGKCAVRIMKEIPQPTAAERTFFTEQALAEGYRLACEVVVADGMEILNLACNRDEQTAFDALDAYTPQAEIQCDRHDQYIEAAYGLAVDIGTTTIAFELVCLSTGQRAGSYAAVNRQRVLGADVVTRIQKTQQGKQDELRSYVIEDIKNGITAVCNASGISYEAVREMFVVGNTTMLHILLGISCEPLGHYPFTPAFTERVRRKFSEIFGADTLDCEVTVLPGISAFVGADITAGIIFCGGPDTESPGLLIDLGTNGEMVLFAKDKIIVTSTAAGPAFEAGNISCGTGSVPGAIAKVSYLPEKNVYSYETIGQKPPVGLCGTGVVDVAAQLVKYEIADETGRLDDAFFESGVPVVPEAGIVFTQKDMREIQLAKSAVRSGLEILLSTAKLTYSDIGRVYIAGGFGHKIDLESAQIIGLIPAALQQKVVAVGNSALGGCVRALLNRQAERDVQRVAEMAAEINLSADPHFNDLFMDHMMFDL